MSDKTDYVTFQVTTVEKTAFTDREYIKITLPRFAGGTARDWLKWSHQFKDVASLKKWSAEDKDFYLRLVLKDEALEAWKTASEDKNMQSAVVFGKVYAKWGGNYIPESYSEQLEEELFLFAKRRKETVAECHQRLRELTRMLGNLPKNFLQLDEKSMIRYFKRAMPEDWKTTYEGSGMELREVSQAVRYFERLEQSERRRRKELGPHAKQKSGKPTLQGGSCNAGRENANGGRGGYQKDNHDKKPPKKHESNHSEKWCNLHHTASHSDSECFSQTKTKGSKWKSKPKASAKKSEESKRVREKLRLEESYSDYEYSDESETKVISSTLGARPKRQERPMRLRMRLTSTKELRVALVDTGCGCSYINGKLAEANKKLGFAVTPSSTVFEHVDGSVKADGNMEVSFRFLDLNYGTRITYEFAVIENSKDEIVIGRDLMGALGLVVNFKDGIIEWNGNTVGVNTGTKPTNTEVIPEMKDMNEIKEINDTSVEPTEMVGDAEIDQVIYKQVVELLTQFKHLYNGHLGRMKFPDYELPITEKYTPIHARSYSIPRSEGDAARREIQRLIELDVIEQIYDSEWASPAFFLKKPDGRLRLLTDFRWLNKFMTRSPYYTALIREIKNRLGGAKYFSSMDANMGYYGRQLARWCRRFTAFCTQFGKFQYKRLPMGVSTAPDEYQACMQKIFGDLDFVIIYLDDILIFSKTAEDHIEYLRVVFERLQEYNVTLNGKKCHVFCKSVDYLGFKLSAEGLEPQEKKVRAILELSTPRNKKELRRFLGMVNYYREMIPSKSALLKPLTRLTSSKVTFMWTSVEKNAFEGVKKALANAVLLAFPDFTKPFDIYADASGKQIGGLIQQDGKLIACYSRSLTKAQQNYTTMELELLSVVEILKEYRTILLGFPIVVHTDPKNLIYPTENSLRVKRWKLLLSEYRLTCEHVQGVNYIAADAFSRMEYSRSTEEYNEEAIDALLVDPVGCVEGQHPKQHQQDDEQIQVMVQSCLNGNGNPDYRVENVMGARLLTFQKRVVIPTAMREELVEWYHVNLIHPGPKRQYHTMKPMFYWSGMEKSILKHCSSCLTYKKAKLHGGKLGYGKIPPREMQVVDPFDVVHVDTIGPYGPDRHYALTVIDEATRWLEVSVQTDNHGDTTAINFDTTWLCRYPRPKKVIFDRGHEFNTSEFREMLASYGIKFKAISSKNPQANAICERVHLVIGNCIRCYPEANWRHVLQYAAFSVRASYHTILGTTPSNLIFSQDLITRKLYEANWNYLSKRRFDAILRENDRENTKRLQHFYNVGHQVLIRVAPKDRKTKHAQIAKGPYAISAVLDNGTVTLDLGATQQQVNIRRLFPC